MLSLQLSEQGGLPWYPGTSLGKVSVYATPHIPGGARWPRAGGSGGDQHQLSLLQRPQKPTQS